MCTPACADAGRPVKLDYAELGSHVDVNGIDTYVTGSGKRGVVFVHDIFGFEFKQVFQVADRIAAAAGCTVAVPYLFPDGGPWPMADYPPSDGEKFMAWIHAQDIPTIESKIEAARVYLTQEKEVTSCGVVGFCWGSMISLHLAGDSGKWKAAACCHPAFFGKEKEFAAAAQVPVCMIPAEGDSIDDAKAELDTKPFAGKCVYQRFDDQVHGFLAARGDYSKPEVAEAAGKGIGILSEFFASCV